MESSSSSIRLNQAHPAVSRRPSRTPRVPEGSRDPGRWRLGRSPPRPELSPRAILVGRAWRQLWRGPSGIEAFVDVVVWPSKLPPVWAGFHGSEVFACDEIGQRSTCATTLETHRQLWTSERQPSPFLCLGPDVAVHKSVVKTSGGAAMQQDSKCLMRSDLSSFDPPYPPTKDWSTANVRGACTAGAVIALAAAVFTLLEFDLLHWNHSGGSACTEPDYLC